MTNSGQCQAGLEESRRVGSGGAVGGSQSLLSPGFGAAVAGAQDTSPSRRATIGALIKWGPPPHSTALCAHSDQRHDFLPLHVTSSPFLSELLLRVGWSVGGLGEGRQIYIIISIKTYHPCRLREPGARKRIKVAPLGRSPCHIMRSGYTASSLYRVGNPLLLCNFHRS